MKHSFRLFFAVLLAVAVCFALVSVSAASDPDALRISAISVTQESGNTMLRMTFQNTGSSDIDEFGLALAFYDENGYRLFGYADTLDGYADEVCNWYYTPEEPIAAGGEYLTEDIFTAYAGTADIGAAIRYYHPVDGDNILLPETEWQWVFPGYEDQEGTLDRGYYTSPPESLFDAIGDFDLGYRYYLLDDYNAFYYGKNQGGEWITSITPGSKAMEAGLQVGDLVIFVDGVKPTENVYAVEYAMAAITAGEKVDWVYERDGAIYTLRMTP